MLEAIREKAQGVVATLIIGVIIVIFGVWGIQSYLEGGSQVNVAKVDGVEISVDAYRSTLDRQRQYMYQLLGKNADPRMFDNPAFRKRVVDNMIDEVLVSQYAQDYGYRVGNQQVAQAVQTTPQFLGQSGQFDSALYLSTLRAAGLTAPGYEQGIREDMTADQVRSGFNQGAIVTTAELDRLLKLETQRRSFSYAVISPEQFRKATPTDAEINDYYSNHRTEFRVPAQARAEVIRLSAASLAKNVKVSDEELRQLYEEESSRYVTPEERRARHILVAVAPQAKEDDAKKALATAQDLRKQVVSGKDFAAIAKKHSQDPGSAIKGGDLGFVRRGAFVKEFDDALFALKPGQISQPVKSKYGYHIIRLESVKPEVRKPFSQARAELEVMLRNRKAEDQFFEATQTLQNLVYENPESLQPAAEMLGLTIERTGWFTSSGGAGISEPKLVEAAFGPDVYAGHRNSDVIELNTTSVAALRVVERQEERLRELSEVRAQIVERLRLEAAAKSASQAAESLLARVNQGGDFAAAARAAGAKITSDKTVSRRKAEGVNPQVVAAVFKAPRPQDKPVHGMVSLGGGGAVVFSLKRVTDGDTREVEPAVRQELERVLERRAGDELFQAYLADLRKRKTITLYENQF